MESCASVKNPHVIHIPESLKLSAIAHVRQNNFMIKIENTKKISFKIELESANGVKVIFSVNGTDEVDAKNYLATGLEDMAKQLKN